MLNKIGRRVRSGCRRLDKKMEGWAKHLKMNGLDMAHPSECVLGRLLSGQGGYLAGLSKLEIEYGDTRAQIENGFDYTCDHDGHKVTHTEYMRELTNQWKSEIRIRRQTKTSTSSALGKKKK